MISIQTNLQAGLIARQLSSTKRQLRTNLERLSTGLRLNRPDDSPGQFGLVINQNLQIQALNQGIINAQNGAGMLQTAQEGINSLIEILNTNSENLDYGASFYKTGSAMMPRINSHRPFNEICMVTH